MHIANVTATYDGETVEEQDDVTRSALSSLLHSGDEIVIHEVHDEDQIDDLQRRYDEWDEKVTVANDEPKADSQEDDAEDDQADAADKMECRHVDCDGEPDMVAHCDTGQEKLYCAEHAGGPRAGHARVETWEEL